MYKGTRREYISPLSMPDLHTFANVQHLPLLPRSNFLHFQAVFRENNSWHPLLGKPGSATCCGQKIRWIEVQTSEIISFITHSDTLIT